MKHRATWPGPAASLQPSLLPFPQSSPRPFLRIRRQGRAGLRAPLVVLALLCCTPAFGGEILQQDISVSRREAVPLRAARGSVQPAEPPQENLLSSMDVYALSPHAARLALPRMISPQMTLAIQQGKAHLPAPAIWHSVIARAAQESGLSEGLVNAVIRAESGYTAHAVSARGACGLMQLMPDTGQEMGVTDPFDPEANVSAGCRYLRRQLDAFGSLELALAAYNAGPGNVRKYGGIPPFAETQQFVRRVLEGMPPQ